MERLSVGLCYYLKTGSKCRFFDFHFLWICVYDWVWDGVYRCVCLLSPAEGIVSHGNGDTGGLNAQHGSWELNSSPLQEQKALLTPEHLSSPKWRFLRIMLNSLHLYLNKVPSNFFLQKFTEHCYRMCDKSKGCICPLCCWNISP